MTEVTDKTTEEIVETAPVMDESDKETSEEAPLDVEDSIDEALVVLNAIDEISGGKGEITEIPEGMRKSVKTLIDDLILIRELFEDSLWKAILDDMTDQKEDGKTPSVEVAVVRNIPIEKLQAIAESEDYEGVQNELASNLQSMKQSEQEEVEYEATFEESRKAGEEYAAQMGYNEEEKNQLFQMVLDLFQIMADGKITVEEFEKVDKMRNYDSDMESMRSQVSETESKEVLPDKASIDATSAGKQPTRNTPPANTPGMGSMAAYDDALTDVTQIGKRKRM